jgi:hypothetical protein
VLNELPALDPAKVAEEDLLDPNPDSAPVYRVEYSLRAQLFEEPQVERELEREKRDEERKRPKGLAFSQNPNHVVCLLLPIPPLYRGKGRGWSGQGGKP